MKYLAMKNQPMQPKKVISRRGENFYIKHLAGIILVSIGLGILSIVF